MTDKTSTKKRGMVKRFYDKFKTVISHHGKNRSERRKAYKASNSGHKLFAGKQHAADKGRRKAKVKARNRRNRKLTRALHQCERRR